MIKKERIDKLLVDIGFADSRTKAQSLIMAGVVLVNERRIEKPSEKVALNDDVRLKGAADELRYVGRGGVKLEAALREFEIDPSGLNCIDVGSSTGGFTDCLLQHGAASVTAVDSGTNQLVWKLRTDPRVTVRERTNARDLKPGDLGDLPFDLAVMDVSFISVKKVIPAIIGLLAPGAHMVVLIKPQFEVGRGEVGKGGIVRDPARHAEVVTDINNFAAKEGLIVRGLMKSPILGAEGNKEFLGCYEWAGPLETGAVESSLVEGRDFHLENGLVVLTREYLLRRGYCCGSGCRNCPYPAKDQRR